MYVLYFVCIMTSDCFNTIGLAIATMCGHSQTNVIPLSLYNVLYTCSYMHAHSTNFLVCSTLEMKVKLHVAKVGQYIFFAFSYCL